MSVRTISRIPVSATSEIKVVRDAWFDEYEVRLYIDGKFSEEATYYTNSKQDALETAQAMKEDLS